MTAREILMGTRRLFTSGKWTKGYFYSNGRKGESFCLVGGLRKTAFGSPYADWATNPNYKEYRKAQNALAKVTGRSLVGFNDSHDTAEPVIDAIDNAIAYLEKSEVVAT